jgi:hypothetical protein
MPKPEWGEQVQLSLEQRHLHNNIIISRGRRVLRSSGLNHIKTLVSI